MTRNRTGEGNSNPSKGNQQPKLVHHNIRAITPLGLRAFRFSNEIISKYGLSRNRLTPLLIFLRIQRIRGFQESNIADFHSVFYFIQNSPNEKNGKIINHLKYLIKKENVKSKFADNNFFAKNIINIHNEMSDQVNQSLFILKHILNISPTNHSVMVEKENITEWWSNKRIYNRCLLTVENSAITGVKTLQQFLSSNIIKNDSKNLSGLAKYPNGATPNSVLAITGINKRTTLNSEVLASEKLNVVVTRKKNLHYRQVVSVEEMIAKSNISGEGKSRDLTRLDAKFSFTKTKKTEVMDDSISDILRNTKPREIDLIDNNARTNKTELGNNIQLLTKASPTHNAKYLKMNTFVKEKISQRKEAIQHLKIIRDEHIQTLFSHSRQVKDLSLKQLSNLFPSIIHARQKGISQTNQPEKEMNFDSNNLILKKGSANSNPVSETKEQSFNGNVSNQVTKVDQVSVPQEIFNDDITLIADRVYQILEKRIAIEKDRRGLF